jgi:hypothetical protein
MSGPFTQRADDDPTGIREWLEWKRGRGGEAVGAKPLPPATWVPQPVYDAQEPPQRVLSAEEEWANLSPVAEPIPVVKKVVEPEPKKAESCYHCDGPMPGMRSAGARYCSEVCKRAARRRLDRLQPYYPD